MRIFLFLAVSLCVFSTEFCADTPTRLGRFGSWEVFKATEDGKPICYMTAAPVKSEGKYKKRGDVFMIITHRPYLKSYYSVSIDAGYGIHRSHKLRIVVSDKTHEFDLIQGETAWISHATLDKTVALAIARARGDVVVKGKSKRGTQTTDTYSTKGSLDALRRMSRACNVKTP